MEDSLKWQWSERERPSLPEQGKKVTLQVIGENGIVVKAELNRKTLKKQVEKMDSFADWVAALSGKIAKVSPDGVIELDRAGVNVFEKKPKATEPTTALREWKLILSLKCLLLRHFPEFTDLIQKVEEGLLCFANTPGEITSLMCCQI